MSTFNQRNPKDVEDENVQVVNDNCDAIKDHYASLKAAEPAAKELKMPKEVALLPRKWLAILETRKPAMLPSPTDHGVVLDYKRKAYAKIVPEHAQPLALSLLLDVAVREPLYSSSINFQRALDIWMLIDMLYHGPALTESGRVEVLEGVIPFIMHRKKPKPGEPVPHVLEKFVQHQLSTLQRLCGEIASSPSEDEAEGTGSGCETA
ncbi:hypothetical protein ISF_04920 [Cordyceps fumosorosea ARSEF 2679]|uniref:Uncharacterized protein n=1 Tax=Cordyceps fumosorosea (strain ARSEF 2679) TaxID=1081104 RepID=A0A167VW52_CORFA|nr:hypothetical protein ISF_04920 [Cordyceps fumosorosea ARSEF 2679]OAA63044.1 hypothetical protein ISF_04920 [Cordyceps fumosorosea ARSEF 2679]